MRRLVPATMFVACTAGMIYGTTSLAPPPKPVERAVVAAVATRPIQTVLGEVSHDKLAIMNDPEVVAAFGRAGMKVVSAAVPGRSMIGGAASGFSWSTDDETSEMIMRGMIDNPWARTQQAQFYTTPVILAWAPAADALARAGMANGRGTWRSVDMRKLVDSMIAGRRWSDVAGGGPWTSDRPIQVRSPDLERSGTATLFLTIASQAAVGGRNVGTREEARSVADRIAPLFNLQGAQPDTLAEAMKEFTAFGISRTPLLIATEADAIQLLAGMPADSGIVVLYPEETIVAPQTFVPRTLWGQKVARVISSETVRKAAIRHGYRIAGRKDVPGTWKEGQAGPPATFMTILDDPEPDLVETMIRRIASADEAAEAMTRARREADAGEAARQEIERRMHVAEAERQRRFAQEALAAGDEKPPERPTIDPEGDAEAQRRQVEAYAARMEAYRARQAVRAQAAGSDKER